MALIHLIDEENPQKHYMEKAAVVRYLKRKDDDIVKHKKKSEDHLALAERWGAKAAEFESGKLLLEAQNIKLKVILGVLVGYNILLTVIWFARNHA